MTSPIFASHKHAGRCALAGRPRTSTCTRHAGAKLFLSSRENKHALLRRVAARKNSLAHSPRTKRPTVCFVEKEAHFEEKYKVCEKLGSGSYGTVFRAQERASGVWFAVKEMVATKKSRAAQNEAAILSSLRGSPAIVQIKELLEEVEETSKTSRLVMELCGGGDLDAFAQADGALSPEQAWAVAVEAIRAASHCHQNKVCHSDMKGGNFLIRSPEERELLRSDPSALGPGWLKLTDMGTARVVGLGACSEPLGTPTYWAPEVFGRKYGVPVDIWATGTMLYRLITGSMPFWSPQEESCIRTQQEIVKKILLGAPDHDALARGCGSKGALADLVERMICKDPAQRPSALSALEALGAVDNEGV